MVAEGHEIGNHTFTHPDISAITRQQLRLEMNATERLLESVVGRRSLLFRPPYAEDVEPETPDQVSPLLFTSSQGYYTIGMAIDPNDWQDPGVPPSWRRPSIRSTTTRDASCCSTTAAATAPRPSRRCRSSSARCGRQGSSSSPCHS